jgi:hypothetical protein
MTLLTGETFAEAIVVKTRLKQIMPNDKVTSICIFDIVRSGENQSLRRLNALNSLLIPAIVSVKLQVTLIFSISIIFITFIIDPILLQM